MKTIDMYQWRKGPALLAALLTLAGCAAAPAYRPPSAAAPAAYREAVAGLRDRPQRLENGAWKDARPAEHMARGQWWSVYDDRLLDELEQQALQENQDLKAAAARLAQARALHRAARSALFPGVDAGLGVTRQKPSAAAQGLPQGAQAAPQTLYRAQLGVSYEADLFGRVGATVDAARADTERDEALLRSVLLALQADVAQHYFALRELDAEARILEQAVALREQALALAQRRYQEGAIGELELARVQSELASASSEAMTVQRLRAVSEHSLAILLGKTPADFAMPSHPLDPVGLRIPTGMPSSLLERRPDIAAAERAMAAANARVGVAGSAFFPSLTLTGAGGVEAGTLGDLFKWSNRTFLLGPLAGTALSLPIFDAGRRDADMARARAAYEGEVARYRQQVLVAFREVEDSLSELRILEGQTVTQARAGKASGRAAELARVQYAEGAISYLEVIDAERTALQARRAAVQLQGSQAAASVGLIRALGGGWGPPSTPR